MNVKFDERGICDFPVAENKNGITIIRVYVDYSAGDSRQDSGYYVYVYPTKQELVRGCLLNTYAPADGFRMLIEPATRRSKKRYSIAQGKAIAGMEHMLDYACKKNHLKMAV
jgi:hypothetical protein